MKNRRKKDKGKREGGVEEVDWVAEGSARKGEAEGVNDREQTRKDGTPIRNVL